MAAPTVLPEPRLRRPFTLAEARNSGVSRDMLRGQRFRRPLRGVFVPSSLPDTVETRVDAARLVLPETAVFSHHTAAILRGLPVDDQGPLHVTVPAGRRRSIRGVVCHQGDVVDMCDVDGRPLVTPERNFTELGSHLPLVDHVVVGDALVRHGWTTVEDLAAAAKRAKGHRGGPAAATAIRLVRARVDSPMETKTRLLLVLAGLPCPDPGREIYDNGGRVAGPVDLQYRAQ